MCRAALQKKLMDLSPARVMDTTGRRTGEGGGGGSCGFGGRFALVWCEHVLILENME